MYEHAGRSRVRGSVRYITHDSCAISVVPPFNNVNSYLNVLLLAFMLIIFKLIYFSSLIFFKFKIKVFCFLISSANSHVLICCCYT